MPAFRDVAGDDPAATRYRVVAAIRDAGVLTRADLARRLALVPSTITSIVRTLSDEGVLVDAEKPSIEGRKPGARGHGLALNPRLGVAVGVDFGFRTVRLLLTDLSAHELAIVERRLDDHYTAGDGLRAIAEMLVAALDEAGIDRSEILAAGVALPGPIDTLGQHVIESAVLPGWSSVTDHDISVALGVPAFLENDANLAALGEHVFGAGRGTHDSITVKFHSGIGGGIIVQDRLVTGKTGGAGEIGHTLVDPRGPLCRCGKRGCLDTYAGVPAILESMSAVHPEIGFPRFIELLEQGDAGALRVARDAADLVGQAVGMAMLLLAPERVIVVGAMARAGDVVLAPIRDAMARYALPATSTVPEVLVGALGDRHTAMGAVARALQKSDWLPRADEAD